HADPGSLPDVPRQRSTAAEVFERAASSARAVAALRDGRCWCRGGSKLGVFPLAVDGFPAVVENEPRGVSTGPALSVPLPGIELGVPCVASQRERRLRGSSAGLGKPVKS